jgi:hypothetical protein
LIAAVVDVAEDGDDRLQHAGLGVGLHVERLEGLPLDVHGGGSGRRNGGVLPSYQTALMTVHMVFVETSNR